MYTVDIHYDGASRASAAYDLDQAITIARRDKDKLLCLIVGRGKGGTHKIKTNTIEILTEYKSKNKVKDFIVGSNLDRFSSAFINFKHRDRIPLQAILERNPGKIYVVL